MNQKPYGFTIIELLIAVVVIAILAAMSIVVYIGMHEKARDARRKSDVANIARMISLTVIERGPQSVSQK